MSTIDVPSTMQRASATRYFRLEIRIGGRTVQMRDKGVDLFVTDDDGGNDPLQQAVRALRALMILRPEAALRLTDRRGTVVWSGAPQGLRPANTRPGC